MNAVDTAKTVGAGLVGVLIIAVLASTVFGVAIDITDFGTDTEEIEPVVGDETELEIQPDDQSDLTIEVAATQARAVSLDGDGYVENATPDGWGDGNWSFAAVATPDTEAGGYGDGVTHVVYSDDAVGLLIAWDRGQWVATYQDGAGSARVEIPATATQTEIVVTLDDGELAIDAGAEVDTALVDADPIEEPTDPYRWVGSIDEVRFVDGVLSDAQIDTYQADPVDPLADATHDGRVMFNDDTDATVRVYFTGDDAQLVDAGLADGVAGPQLEVGVDFETSTDPLTVSVPEGSYLAGAPAAFVTVIGGAAAFVALLQTIAGTGSAAVALLVVGLLVLAARSLIDTFGGGGFSR